MKTSDSKSAPQELAGTVQVARLQVAIAEGRWTAAREQARIAKLRRKEVKLIARRAKKQAKQAKTDLAEARKALAEAETRLAESGFRMVTRKPARTRRRRPAAKAIAAAPRKKASPARHRRKVVKLIARRAKQQAKPAKAIFAKPRKAPVEVEAKLAVTGVRLATRKPAQARRRPVARVIAGAPGTKPAPARKDQPAPTAPSPAPESATQVKPASLQQNAPSPVPAQAVSVIGTPDGGTPEPAVIAWAAAAAETRTKPNQEIQPRKRS